MERFSRTRRLSCMSVVVGLAALALLAGCGAEEFAVGDCVTTEQRLTDSELKPADCPEAGSLDLRNPVYMVDEVLEGTDGRCGSGRGFGVQFEDEPADKIYCLSPAR